MPGRKQFLFVVLLFVSACSAQPTQVQPTAEPTRVIDSGHGITSEEPDLPLNETEVPRISLEEAKSALENGTALLVDVRGSTEFDSSHIAGAVSVPLVEIERNITELALDKNQWIITYCT
jgi:hypothetical protein